MEDTGYADWVSGVPLWLGKEVSFGTRCWGLSAVVLIDCGFIGWVVYSVPSLNSNQSCSLPTRTKRCFAVFACMWDYRHPK